MLNFRLKQRIESIDGYFGVVLNLFQFQLNHAVFRLGIQQIEFAQFPCIELTLSSLGITDKNSIYRIQFLFFILKANNLIICFGHIFFELVFCPFVLVFSQIDLTVGCFALCRVNCRKLERLLNTEYTKRIAIVGNIILIVFVKNGCFFDVVRCFYQRFLLIEVTLCRF